MEQLEFDCRLESERELEENVNIALEICLQAGQGNQQVEGIEPPRRIRYRFRILRRHEARPEEGR